MWHRPSRWTLAAFAFAVAAGFIAWLVLGRSERTLRLADGREFSIVAITYGTNHVLEGGPPWARLIHRYGSSSLAARLGYKTSGSHPSPVPSIMIWTRWSPGHSNTPPDFASVADKNGLETEPAGTLATRFISNMEGLVAWHFENYPRYQNELSLRFYRYDLFRIRARREGDVTIRNPAAIPRPSPPGPAAPVSSTNGTLEITLTSLRCSGPPPRLLLARSAVAPWNTAEFEFHENGQPTTNWTIRRIEAFGAASNHFVGDRLAVETEGSRRIAHFTGAFWPEELDWRLVAEATLTRNYPPESLWTVRLPTGTFFSGVLVTNLQADVRGLNFFQLQISPGLRGDATPDRRVAFLRANFTPAGSDLRVDIAGATDDENRELRIDSLVSRAVLCEGEMELPATAKFVDLTFAIHRSRKVEFRVRPEFISTNAPMNKP